MTGSFRFAYDPADLVYGRGCVDRLAESLARSGSERALVVSGRTVGTTPSVVDPVTEGLGERLAGVFAETTPDKRLRTAHEAAERVRSADVDALVALGGGSSLDIAAFAAILAARGLGYEAARDELVETGAMAIPDGVDLLSLFVVPTTLAGADLSVVAGVTDTHEGDLVRGMAFDGRLMPAAVHYDPALFETTPHDVLRASAMNGFDKGVEALYSAEATPVTDGTATRGLRLLRRGLPALGRGERDEETLHDSIVGTMLVQYGFTRAVRAEERTATVSLVHAFGHGIARGYDIQQGGAHAIIAPHALAFLFDRVSAGRDLLAEALAVETAGRTDGEVADGIVEAVTEVRDALGLPTRLRSIPDMTEADLPRVAESVHGDGLMAMTPEGFDPSVEEIESVLREAW